MEHESERERPFRVLIVGRGVYALALGRALASCGHVVFLATTDAVDFEELAALIAVSETEKAEHFCGSQLMHWRLPNCWLRWGQPAAATRVMRVHYRGKERSRVCVCVCVCVCDSRCGSACSATIM